MVPDPLSGPPHDDLFAAGGEAGRLMAEFDWASTSVGPVEQWPASLRFAVRTVLVSRFPTIVLWGPDFLQFYNDAYAPVLGAKHPAIGLDIRRTQPETWDALGPPIERVMTTLEASWMPVLLLPLDRYGFREETYFTVSHAPAFDDDGEVAGIHAVCSEVTGELVGARRQRLLRVLADVGGRLRTEQETVTAMCRSLTDDALDVPFAAVYLGVPGRPGFVRSAVAGCDAELLPVAVDGPGDLPTDVEHFGLTGGPFGDRVTAAVVLPLRTARDAEPFGVLVAGRNPNLALDADHRAFHDLVAGQFAGAVANARAYAEERMRAEALEALDRAKTTFFSDVSHELRTPLTLLLGPVRDVLDDPAESLTDEGREQLSLALRNGQRLQRLVNDLLDVASIEAGRTHPVRVATDVSAFTSELAGIFRAAAERAGLALVVDCAPLPGPVFVDPRMWEKVVVNLLSNAVKYTFVGGIAVTLGPGADGGFDLTVTDTGVGIPAEEIPHLFERFHRISGSAARTREGTGIGLALVHELVDLHGGTVTVASTPGSGSRFTVTMPLGSPDEVATAPVHPSEAARGEAAGWEQDTARPSGTAAPSSAEVLVVDDNSDMRAYLTRILSPSLNVRTTANGEEALAAIRERRPDVVVTDVMMPRVDGFELLRRLRADPATATLPVLLLTARAGQEASVEGFEAGADDYLAKPFRAAELVARVRVALERAGRRAAGAGAVAPAPPSASGPVPEPGPGPSSPPVHGGARVQVAAPRIDPLVESGSGPRSSWRMPSSTASVPVLRRRIRTALAAAGVDEDHAYDLLLAVCEAVTNAVEHAQDPTDPYVEVAVAASDELVEITVRDSGRWREREASLDRGRGSTLMSAVGTITVTPSPQGTTVLIRSPRRAATLGDQVAN